MASETESLLDRTDEAEEQDVTCHCGWTFHLPLMAGDLADHDCVSDQFHRTED